jgi:replicative DNA helicase
MTTGLNKIPPQNLEAEQSVLGCLLLDKEAIIKVGDILRPEDFYKDAHGLILEAMYDLYEKREPIDILSLSNRLKDKNQLEMIGGQSYLADLANSVPTASHVLSYAKIIQKKATLRRLLRAAGEISELGFKEDEEIDDIMDQAEQKLFNISQKYLKQNFVPIKNILTDAFNRIDELHKQGGKLRGTSTGFVDLDHFLGGLQKSDLIIIAARPSVGKTSFALDIARQVAVNEKVPVGLLSLEMSKEQLIDRLICAEAGVNLWKMHAGKLSDNDEDDDFPRIGQAMGVLSEAQIFIDDSATANIMEIRTKARRLKLEHGLGLLVIDYLQLMEGRSSNGGDNRVQEVSEITRSLKSIARELDIPVIALSQLSRAVEQQNGPAIPRLAHLRESGSIEQDADIVMFIYRKAADRKYRRDELSEEERNVAEIHIAKHRNGPIGEVKLFFHEEQASFKNLERSTPNYI